MENKNSSEIKKRSSLFWPLMLIAAGIFLLLNTLNVIRGSAWDVVFRFWPILFIVGGLDNIYKQEGFVSPIFWIGIGTLLLLSNLGYVVFGSWMELLRFWPLILIAIGLDLIIGQHTPLSAVLGLILGVGLVAVLVWFAVFVPERWGASFQTETFQQNVVNANQASIDISLPAGNLSIADGASGKTLISADVNHLNSQTIKNEYSEVGEKGRLTLQNVGSMNYLYPPSNLDWNIQLNPEIETDLAVDMVAGEQNLDFNGLEIHKLESEIVFGTMKIELPDEDMDGKLDVSIGKIVLLVPPAAGLKINLDSGITSISIPDGYSRTENLLISDNFETAENQIIFDINQPIGSLIISQNISK